jgi:2-polyprenyl-6-methoxyphenol hydroxylase-like FAD-dependent oxidoreductase
MMLAVLLARAGVAVTLLEAHEDFDREFRGDTLHPSILEILAQLGLADGLLRLPHTKIRKLTLPTPEGPLVVTDFGALRTRFPWITVMPQSAFLEYLAEDLRRHGGRLLLGARVDGLVRTGDAIVGVAYTYRGARCELRSQLTVGADGRSSRVRQLAGIALRKQAPPMDVLWFRLARLASDDASANLSVHLGAGYYFALTDRGQYWQVSYVIPKGTYRDVRAAGLPAFRASISDLLPMFAGRVEQIVEWAQVSFLSVGSGFVTTWHRPGLLLIGDAAHVMSSVGGIGINCAVQDAVVAANVLAAPLREGRLRSRHLASVARRRGLTTRLLLILQDLAQRSVVARVLDRGSSAAPPALVRLPFFRYLTAYVTAFGLYRVSVRT